MNKNVISKGIVSIYFLYLFFINAGNTYILWGVIGVLFLASLIQDWGNKKE